jgi:hypothetical protein
LVSACDLEAFVFSSAAAFSASYTRLAVFTLIILTAETILGI